jgi:enoyl-CoA hydratase/carnithine racemase
MFFIKMGLVPELASTHLLVQRAGVAQASEMCLSGRLYSAQEALALFSKCVGMPEHREAVRAFREKRPPDFRRN